MVLIADMVCDFMQCRDCAHPLGFLVIRISAEERRSRRRDPVSPAPEGLDVHSARDLSRMPSPHTLFSSTPALRLPPV